VPGTPLVSSELGAPLSGVRALDFSRIVAGPLAAQILGDFGADVIKVEPPAGDEARLYGASPETAGPSFVAFNRNKRSICLDLKVSRDQRVLDELLASADVLVHNYRPKAAERLGISYEQLKERYPRLIYCAISGFGTVGPLVDKPAVDLIAQAYSGLLSMTGEADRDPVRVPVSITDLSTGMNAVLGVLLALRWRDATGRGQKVETSLLESVVALMSSDVVSSLSGGPVRERMGTRNKMGQPNQVFRLRDGLVAVAAPNDAMWRRFCRAIEAVDLADDRRFLSSADRTRNRDVLSTTLERRLVGHRTAEVLERLEREGVVCARVNSIEQMLEEPQVGALEMTTRVQHDDQTFVMVRNPVNLSASPASIRRGPPMFDADGAAIRAELEHARATSTAVGSRP
jgi:crotonobetainyl-CoA:carnitine CoA-transferase CaiB-like acyl-CoA transferase